MLEEGLPIQLMADLEGRKIEVISFIKIKYLTTNHLILQSNPRAMIQSLLAANRSATEPDV